MSINLSKQETIMVNHTMLTAFLAVNSDLTGATPVDSRRRSAGAPRNFPGRDRA
jgi:hypothetical protein